MQPKPNRKGDTAELGMAAVIEQQRKVSQENHLPAFERC